MAEVGVSAEDELGTTETAPDLLTLHESIADLFATRGDWRRAYQHLRSALDIARAGSLRDPLTSSYNRRYLDQRLPGLPASRSVAVALVDLDRFKSVNDTYGHLLGDRVLCRVADLLQEGLPPDAFCARYGGEEFALVLPGVDHRRAVRIADAARLRVARHPWSELQPGLRVTISVGLAHGAGSGSRQLHHADNLLYAAKRAGRNKVAFHDRETARVITHSE
ncbi:GGDEF domain-containing protein [Amycolatopsis jejuensis]|uniref:GGDEF domain-containing protein n=1 Tax=Amycolatopsis jejuensis TaxID=330084 RepID=UPI00052695DB|nr:GGDEF domain-containing protein [Amycolatopsis jejuensis]